jgi:small subunit ribosomal protein S33
MTSLYRYLDLIKLQTPYAKRMQFLSNRIFGEIGELQLRSVKIENFKHFFSARPTNIKSTKVARMYAEQPREKKDWVGNWYPRHVETFYLMQNLRSLGLYRDEHQDWKEEMRRMRFLRGKRPFVKGQGKRASKK